MDPVSCPFCRNMVANDPRCAGRVVSCPHCSNAFQMPVAAPPPQAQQDDPLGFLNEPSAPSPPTTAGVGHGIETVGASFDCQWKPFAHRALSRGKPGSYQSARVTPGMIVGGIAIAFAALILIAVAVNPARDPSATRGNVSPKSATAEKRITVEEFRHKIEIGAQYPKGEFFAKFGRPSKIMDIGDTTYLMYECADGVANVKCVQPAYQYAESVICVGVDQD